MEHRLAQRLALSLPVCLRAGGGIEMRARIRNASADGLFIAVDTSLAGIRQHAVVDVEGIGVDGAWRGGESDTTYVVHRAADGIGVMFTSSHGPLRDAIRAMIGEARGAARPLARIDSHAFRAGRSPAGLAAD